MENIYEYEGSPGHEVVFVFEVEFSEASAYATEKYTFVEQGISVDVEWRKISEFLEGSESLFPNGLRHNLG